MRIYKDISLEDFEAWSGAVDTMDTLKDLETNANIDVWDILETCIDEFDEGMDETEVNDFLWFEIDTIAEWLGYENWEQLERAANGESIEEIELAFSVGDVVNYNGEKCIIIEVDENDKDLPYFVKNNSTDEAQKINWDFQWCSIEELEAWEDE